MVFGLTRREAAASLLNWGVAERPAGTHTPGTTFSSAIGAMQLSYIELSDSLRSSKAASTLPETVERHPRKTARAKIPPRLRP